MGKKTLLFCFLILAAAFLLSGCEKAMETHYVEITDLNGAGFKKITASVSKKNIVDPGVSVTDYFPKGMQAVKEFLEKDLPEGFLLEMQENTDAYIFILSYTFASLEDYNEKNRLLIGEERWNAGYCDPATITVKEGENGKRNVTFKDDSNTMRETTYWAYSLLFNKGEAAGVFYPGGKSGSEFKIKNPMDLVSDQSRRTTIRFLDQEAVEFLPEQHHKVTAVVENDGSISLTPFQLPSVRAYDPYIASDRPSSSIGFVLPRFDKKLLKKVVLAVGFLFVASSVAYIIVKNRKKDPPDSENK